MKKSTGFASVAMLFLCTGCITNNYERFYVDSACERNFEPTRGDAPVIIKPVTTEDDVLSIIEDGYAVVGSSSFSAPYTPMSCAVDTARRHGADLVLLDIRFKETRQYTSVMYLPSYSTTYAYGRVYSTQTMNAVPVRRNVDVYCHDAMFFRKADASRSYGIRWLVPKRLPTDGPDSPVEVRVLAVLHGSKAERAGIRRGQVVKAVNGRPIRTRADVAQYLSDETRIEEVEVEDAQ